jgi:hypothetical protein
MIYPLVSWDVVVPAFTITVAVTTASGTVTETLNVPAGTYRGWQTTGTQVSGQHIAETGSLAWRLAQTLLTHSLITTVVPVYDYGTSLITSAPGYMVLLNPTSLPTVLALTITATSNAAALALFGITAPISSIGAILSVTRRTAGVWRPNTDGGRQEPDYTVVGSGAWSPYNPAANDRIRIGGQLAWLVSWEFVQASDITREINGLADYLPLAGRAAGDTDGTLDDLVEAAAQGLDLSLALPPIGAAAVDYRTCIIPETGNLSRSRFTTEAAVGGRMYSVTLPLLETREVTA